jgi:hypothetical protein
VHSISAGPAAQVNGPVAPVTSPDRPITTGHSGPPPWFAGTVVLAKYRRLFAAYLSNTKDTVSAMKKPVLTILYVDFVKNRRRAGSQLFDDSRRE